jgi:hypothetical protein
MRKMVTLDESSRSVKTCVQKERADDSLKGSRQDRRPVFTA